MQTQTATVRTALADPDLLTADQVVDRLLKFPKLRQLTATCVLPAVRVESEWRFRRGELEAWHETLGTKTAEVTIGADGKGTVTFSYGAM